MKAPLLKREKMKKIVDKEYSRLDVCCAELVEFSRSYCKRLIEEGKILLNGKCAKVKDKVSVGDEIEFLETEKKELDLTPANIPLDIVYQDEYFAIINKPQGLSVHAGNSYDTEVTLVNALLYHLDNLSGINGVIRPGIVHRIDKNTSGLLVVAKNDFAHKNLAEQIENKTCKRIYLALLEGVIKTDDGIIETFIDRSVKDRTKMAVSDSGRYAKTYYKVVARYQNYTLCQFELFTGRTHQIRVHAKHLGFPVVGDPEYGFKKQKFNLEGQLLHAYKLELTHPKTCERMTFETPLPDYFQNVLNKIENTKI